MRSLCPGRGVPFIYSWCATCSGASPSRRALASLLGVNPNTIQKACALLEEEGIIASHTGAKSVVTADETVRRRLTEELLEYDASTLVRGLRQMGITRAQAVELVERLWDQEERV